MAAVAQHGAGVANAENLLHSMRHVKNRAILPLELLDYFEKLFDLPRRQRTGRLIKCDHPCAVRKSLGDFDHLPLADGETCHQRARVDLLAKSPELLDRVVA